MEKGDTWIGNNLIPQPFTLSQLVRQLVFGMISIAQYSYLLRGDEERGGIDIGQCFSLTSSQLLGRGGANCRCRFPPPHV